MEILRSIVWIHYICLNRQTADMPCKRSNYRKLAKYLERQLRDCPHTRHLAKTPHGHLKDIDGFKHYIFDRAAGESITCPMEKIIYVEQLADRSYSSLNHGSHSTFKSFRHKAGKKGHKFQYLLAQRAHISKYTLLVSTFSRRQKLFSSGQSKQYGIG